MKVPALRRGNPVVAFQNLLKVLSLNESPRPKAGKLVSVVGMEVCRNSLNESPRPKAGKSHVVGEGTARNAPQ